MGYDCQHSKAPLGGGGLGVPRLALMMLVQSPVMKSCGGPAFAAPWAAAASSRRQGSSLADTEHTRGARLQVGPGDTAWVDVSEEGAVVVMNKANVAAPTEIVYSSS